MKGLQQIRSYAYRMNLKRLKSSRKQQNQLLEYFVLEDIVRS